MEPKARAALASLERQPADVLAILAEAIEAAEEPDELDPELWGPPPTPAEAGLAAAKSAKALAQARAEVCARSLSRTQVAQALGVSAQAVSQRLEAKRLVAVRQGRELRFPAWQLPEEDDKEGSGGVLPGLPELIQVFPAGPVALSRWAVCPSPDLDGRSPRDLLARGDVEPVIALASALTAAGW